MELSSEKRNCFHLISAAPINCPVFVSYYRSVSGISLNPLLHWSASFFCLLGIFSSEKKKEERKEKEDEQEEKERMNKEQKKNA